MPLLTLRPGTAYELPPFHDWELYVELSILTKHLVKNNFLFKKAGILKFQSQQTSTHFQQIQQKKLSVSIELSSKQDVKIGKFPNLFTEIAKN